MGWSKKDMPNFFQLVDEMAKRYIELLKSDYKMNRRVKGKNRNAYASGNLYRSLAYRLKIKGNGIQITAYAKGSASQYFEVRELGRKPNSTQPPVDAIVKWMKIKPIKLRNAKGSFVKQTDELMRQAAYRIAKKIGKDGIEGWNGNAYAVENVTEEYQEKIIDAYKKDVQFVIEQKFKGL